MVGRWARPKTGLIRRLHAEMFLREQWVYLAHVFGLIRPGASVPNFNAHPAQPQSLAGWTNDELQLMIDEGRRQSDRQQADLEQIRSRAQWLFTVGAPVVVAI